MKLVSLAPDGALGVVLEGPDGAPGIVAVADLDRSLPTTMAELLAGGPDALAALRPFCVAEPTVPGGLRNTEAVQLLAPVPEVRQIIGVGRNYREHAEELGNAAPDEPLLFAKLPSSVAAPGADIVWDPEVTTQVDYEAELGVVIGRTTSRVAAADALDSVFGYCCVNDITARDLQRSDKQWVRAKASDTFCPFGPYLVTADEVPDPQALHVRCWVNGEERQSDSTASMFFTVAEIVAYVSRVVTLLPGDLITTGTPAGVGAGRTPPALLRHGDEVAVEVSGLGRLVNRCRTL